VSTLGQVEHGVSLEVQRAQIESWCVANGYILAEIKVDEGLSGGRADNRPALQQAMATLRRGDALVVFSLSRLARSTRDTLLIADALKRRGADLVSLSENIDTTTANGRMSFHLMAMLSEFERAVTAERTASAMWHLQRQGRYIGGHTPYGWVRGEDKAARVVCIAGDFTKFDIHAVQQINRNIELIRFTRFGDDLLFLELMNGEELSQPASTTSTPPLPEIDGDPVARPPGSPRRCSPLP